MSALLAGAGATVATALAAPPLDVDLLVGSAAAVAVYAALAALLRGRCGGPARHWSWWQAAGVLLLLVAVAALVSPLGDPSVPAAAVPGTRSLRLPDGSVVAYRIVPGRVGMRTAPLVVVHGGPGVADLAGEAAVFGRLATSGRTVVVYDQVGAGLSSRLSDPRGYTLAHSLAELDAVRTALHAPRIDLLGHSYGGWVAAAYTAAHPDRVIHLVLSAPGRLRDGLGGNVQARLDWRQRLTLYRLLAPPRALLAWALLQADPRAAHRVLGDAEADARMDRVYAVTDPALHCPDGEPGPRLHGVGFYLNQVPQARSAPEQPDLRPALARVRVPVLVIKPQCDYLPWSAAADYLRVLPAARLVHLVGAGHDAWRDQPQRYLRVVAAFLDGHPVPAEPHPATPPADYRGRR